MMYYGPGSWAYDTARRRMIDKMFELENTRRWDAERCRWWDAEYDNVACLKAKYDLIARFNRTVNTHPAELPYAEFLESPYWLALSEWIKNLVEWTCEGCEVRGYCCGLDVHHKTYEHRGFEFPDHLEDLEVLCRDCHKKRHPGWSRHGLKEEPCESLKF